MTYFSRLIIVFSLLLLTSCKLDQEKVVYVADAENLMYTDDDRLLVTGKKNIYEIKKTDGGYYSEALYPPGGCIFNGVAQYGKWVFTICNRGFSPWKLYAAGLKDNGEIRFSEVGRLPGFILANGMTFTPQGDLLIADTNLLKNKNYGLAKVKINHSAMPDYNAPDPQFDASKIIVSINKKWLDLNPNGVRIKDNILYVSELNTVWKYHLDATGEILDSQLLLTQKGYLDDLYPICGGAIVANYGNGTLFYVDKNGYIDPHFQTPPNSLGGPTAMTIARDGLFPQGGLLVTEAGIPFEFSGKLGDKLVRLDMGIDFASLETSCDSAH